MKIRVWWRWVFVYQYTGSDSHLTCKVANKYLNVRERVELVEWNKRWSSPFPWYPVSCQCPWKKTRIDKKQSLLQKKQLPQKTINYILAEIYDHQKLKPVCSKLIFKRLLLKLTTESTFIFNIKYYKQTDGCTMGRLLSVVLSDIYMTKLEKDAILTPRKPKLYKRFVHDIFTRQN